MKTVVYQSYRTTNVPAWITRCMESVQAWTGTQGFDYRFVDDRLFEYVPRWFRAKVSDHILLVSDLARLKLAREFLGEGYERTIWIDADVLIFAPEKLQLNVSERQAFCREFWVERDPQGRLYGKPQVNNAVTVFTTTNKFLEYYIDACESLVRNAAKVDKLMIGTKFLSDLHAMVPFPLITEVGIFSPVMMQAFQQHPVEQALRSYMEAAGSPIYGANLCSSYRNNPQVTATYDRVMEGLIEGLLNAPRTVFEK